MLKVTVQGTSNAKAVVDSTTPNTSCRRVRLVIVSQSGGGEHPHDEDSLEWEGRAEEATVLAQALLQAAKFKK